MDVSTQFTKYWKKISWDVCVPDQAPQLGELAVWILHGDGVLDPLAPVVRGDGYCLVGVGSSHEVVIAGVGEWLAKLLRRTLAGPQKSPSSAQTKWYNGQVLDGDTAAVNGTSVIM